MDLRGRPVASNELPLPPQRLVLVEDEDSYPVRLESWERTEWPSPPPQTVVRRVERTGGP
ncbi:hypothetical protein HRW12_00215 [Streptomyces lunaelactis]|uniref:hypothetical protein n=1 Tax=Streptomyces lunaelactis TaxID=1535768 RepID=UPI001584CFA0|nr:hypothetical protein [Streptomyces lunaelactis]NUK32221.1 hypothetical protein [Streptomyces lunaelactis]